MRKLKHLPPDLWSEIDHEAFRVVYQPGDLFDETRGSGAHLAEGTRRMIRTAWRRWLGFLVEHYPHDLRRPPADRIRPDRARDFIEQLRSEVRPTTVAHVVANLFYAARLIAPATDWRWLVSIKGRLAALARPMDRFDRLVPPWQILDFGIELMDEALTLPRNDHKQRDLQFRDGLILALLSLWLIRRRSLAALTISRHLQFDAAGLNILLYPEDTKAKRGERFRVPEQLLPYLLHYLKEIRPRLLGRRQHDGLWASCKGCPLSGGRLYDIVRARMITKFGKAMGLHDLRRAAATYLAMDAPDMVGLIPGMLQHASPDVGERIYNLAGAVEASRRYATHVARTRERLRPISLRTED